MACARPSGDAVAGWTMAIALANTTLVAVLAAGSGPADGSIHAEHRDARPQPQTRVKRELDPPSAGTEFTTWVYGYYATWAGELVDLPWDRLTHVAIFDVQLTASGALAQTSNWTDYAAEAVMLGAPYGVRIHLAVTCFDAATMAQVLDNPGTRVAAADALAQLVSDHGGHGVSVDFEGMGATQSAGLVAFVQELKMRVEDVTVATPAVDWNGAYDYSALAESSDGLFLMGYDYHWAGGDPGPIAPLNEGGVFGQYSLEWSLNDHEAFGAPPDTVILGLPLYGRTWPSANTNVPGSATGQASTLLYSDAAAEIGNYERLYESTSATPYYFPNSTTQNWYDDVESLDAKIGWAVERGVRGIGFWALNYDGGDPALWDVVALHTQIDAPDPSGTTDGGGDDTGEPPPDDTTTGDVPPSEDESGPAPDPGGTTDDGDDGQALPSTSGESNDEAGCGCTTTPSHPRALALATLVAGGWLRRRRPRHGRSRASRSP